MLTRHARPLLDLPRRRRAALAATVAATLAVPVASPAPAGAAADHSTSPVMTIPPPAPSQAGSSTLVRNDHGVSLSLDTTMLTPDDVVTLWWVVFNHPEECDHPFANSPCGPDDVPNPDTGASLLHAAGRIVDEDGTASYGAHLRVGDTASALVGPGLLDARGAVVVAALKTHGPRIPELVVDQRTTFAGSCADQSDVPPGAPPRLVGPEGPNDCAEIQFTVHVP